MNSNEGNIKPASQARRKFVWGISILSVYAAIKAATGFSISAKKNILACAPEKTSRTVKMLTEDGTLVEIDESFITAARKKINNDELRDWIKK